MTSWVSYDETTRPARLLHVGYATEGDCRVWSPRNDVMCQQRPSAVPVRYTAHEIQTLLTVRSANVPASCCEEVNRHARVAD